MEYLDAVDEEGRPTGETVPREEAHRRGIRHRTSHVWVLRQRAGRLQVLLQRRSERKDSFPGCWDCSSAGHIPAGEDFLPSALRELREELGVEAKAEELRFCGWRHCRYEGSFYGEPFLDDEVTNVYCLFLDREPEAFTLQKEELSCVRWFDAARLEEAIRTGDLPHCIFPEELALITGQRKSPPPIDGTREGMV